jgi:hypothetical protein
MEGKSIRKNLGFSRQWLWGMPSFGMRSRVGLVCYRIPSAVSRAQIDSTLKMEETRFCETSALTRPTRRHIPEDGILHRLKRPWQTPIWADATRKAQYRSFVTKRLCQLWRHGFKPALQWFIVHPSHCILCGALLPESNSPYALRFRK